ncbi:MAG: hypothetical protein WBD22_01920 [Pyrinomonadaceae bacterium]
METLYTTAYVYNQFRGLIEETYPNGPVVKNKFDNAGKKNVADVFSRYAGRSYIPAGRSRRCGD